MKKISYLSLASVCVLGLISACDPVNVPNPTPTASSSIKPSASPGVKPGTQPSVIPSPQASAAVSGKITVTGAENFDAFNINYKPGMKWVYSMKLGGIEVPSLPAGITLPAGFEIPGFGGGDGDIGTFTMEVVSVNGNLITLRSDVSSSSATFPDTPPTESTFEKKNASKVYAEAFASNGSGSLNWSSAGSESVTVPAGTYAAGLVRGTSEITVESGQLKQNIRVWMVNNVGMVKETVNSETMASGVSVKSDVTLELKSFSG